MKKIAYTTKKSVQIRKNAVKVLFSLILTFVLIAALPLSVQFVHAAPLEDCDLDGYDDATGVPVPWPGYDETKGDTPEKKGGTSGTKPANNTSTPAAGAGNTSNTPPANANNTPSSGTNSPASGNGNNSPNPPAAVKSDNTSENVNPAPVGNTNAQPAAGNGTSSTVNKGGSPSSATANTTSVNSDNSQVEQADKSDGETKENEQPVAPDTVNSENELAASVSADAVFNTKGLLKISDTEGSVIHVGGTIIVSGSGFARNIADLKVEIHSEPQLLGSVTSSKDGVFEAKFNIPENLESGTHNIVVLYQGKEITRQQIEVAPKAADTFWEALSIGFSAQNQGLVPGLIILASLVVLGGAGLLVNGITGSRRETI